MNIRRSNEDPEVSPRFFKALCDSNRIAILKWLGGKGEAAPVKDVACCCDVDLSVVSRHLAIMREAGILRAQKRGKEDLKPTTSAWRSRARRTGAGSGTVQPCPHSASPTPRNRQPLHPCTQSIAV